MIQFENHLGTISISRNFLVDLITNTATNCFGVAGMSCCSQGQGIVNRVLKRNDPGQAIRVRYQRQKLVVDLHILVIYGMNISAVVRSISNKVRYAIEETTGVSVSSVNVYIDGMKI